MNHSEILIRKRDLEIILQSIPAHPTPKIELEQYTIPANLAADILYHACYRYGDIQDRSVIELGSGTGRLALGAMLLGAESVLGIDVDIESVQLAQLNSRKLKLRTDWLLSDIGCVHGHFDTVLMNPPFGTKQQHNDIRFLTVALNLGKVIYTIHKSATTSYLETWLQERNATSEKLMETSMPIEHQFTFHRKRRYYVKVQVFRIDRGKF